jgi:hypothetical protein
MTAEFEWDENQFHAVRERHEARVGPFTREHLARRSRGEKHPVWDFLFEYYSFKPSHLLRFSPGAQVLVRGQNPDFAPLKYLQIDEDGARLDIAQMPPRQAAMLDSALEILRATHERVAFHGCFGLHEWAMVYRCDEARHSQVAMRLSEDEIAAFVESQTIRCSHYDAFRFFTPNARPLNVLSPDFASRAAHEQGGCIHANMDLYKWAYKFYPWISSDLIADAFEVAIQARQLDMRATPYDLRAWGFEPICIETPDGRREYQMQQREVAENARPVRAKLIAALQVLAD